MKIIERPDWKENLSLTPKELNFLMSWFDKNLQGKVVVDLKDAVEVKGFLDDDGEWHLGTEKEESVLDTHTGLVVNIKPIKKETAEDVLRDLLNKAESNEEYFLVDYLDRAKAVLDEKA